MLIREEESTTPRTDRRRRRVRRHDDQRSRSSRYGWLQWLGYGGLALGLLFYVPDQILLNWANVLTLRSAWLTADAVPLAQERLQIAAAYGKAQAYWQLSLLATWQGDSLAQQQAQVALLKNGGGRRLALLRIVAADNPQLAQQALHDYPTRPEVLAWRADQLVMSQPTAAIVLYSKALQIDPVPYDWWMGLGKAYAQLGQDERALAAYRAGCTRAWGVLPCHEIGQLEQKIQAQHATK